jgi:hypothetical protein
MMKSRITRNGAILRNPGQNTFWNSLIVMQVIKIAFAFSSLILDSMPAYSLSIEESTLRKSECLNLDSNSKARSFIFEKYAFGLGYSRGFCLSKVLTKRGFFLSPSSYQLNTISIRVFREMNPWWRVSVGGEYGFANLDNRNMANFIVLDSLGNSAYTYRTDWEINIIPVFIAIDRRIGRDWYLTLGLEFYYSEGYSENSIELWNYNTHGYDTLNLYTKHWERGYGVSCGIYWERKLANWIGLRISTTIKVNRVREFNYDFQEPLIWVRQTNFNFSGLYVNGSFVLGGVYE